MGLKDDLLRAADLGSLPTKEAAARATIMEKARLLADYRRANDGWLASRSTKPREVERIANEITNNLYVSWAAHPGLPSSPTNDPARKRLVELALAESPRYLAALAQCAQIEMDLEMMQRDYEDACHRRTALMYVWQQGIFSLAPEILPNGM